MRTDIVFVTWTHTTALDSLGDGVVSVTQPLSRWFRRPSNPKLLWLPRKALGYWEVGVPDQSPGATDVGFKWVHGH
jgi:hypothetical protein